MKITVSYLMNNSLKHLIMKKLSYTPMRSAIVGLIIVSLGIIANTFVLTTLLINYKADNTLFIIVLTFAELLLLGTVYAIIKDMKLCEK